MAPSPRRPLHALLATATTDQHASGKPKPPPKNLTTFYNKLSKKQKPKLKEERIYENELTTIK